MTIDYRASDLFRQRIAAELLCYQKCNNLSFQSITEAILQSRAVTFESYRRDGYKPISHKSLTALAENKRKTHKRILAPLAEFLTDLLSLPRQGDRFLVFDIDNAMVNLAKEHKRAMAIRLAPRSITRKLAGKFVIYNESQSTLATLIVDYFNLENLLLVRGNIEIISFDKKRHIPSIFISGFAIPASHRIFFFLTDHFRMTPYIFSLQTDEKWNVIGIEDEFIHGMPYSINDFVELNQDSCPCFHGEGALVFFEPNYVGKFAYHNTDSPIFWAPPRQIKRGLRKKIVRSK